ncbi:MAG: DUF4230 domain-containing protein [Spartobacteria bacterium]
MKEENAQRSTLNVQRRKQSGFSWPIALTLVALIIAAVVVVIFLRLESWPARTVHQGTAELERLGQDLRSAFVDIAHLQPRISINNRVYLEQTTPISELSILSRRIEVEHEFQHTWAGSSKRVKLHGTFNVKAGFDLHRDFSVDVRPEEIVVQIPHAEILGVEQQQVDVLEFQNGFWNLISADDVQTQLSTLPQLAKQKAEEAKLPEEAERALQEQLEARLHPQQPLRLLFGTTPKKE